MHCPTADRSRAVRAAFARRFAALAWALAAAPVATAQTTGDAALGRDLFENTTDFGIPGITANCTACHVNVENRRIVIGAGLGRPNPTGQDYLSDDDITAAFSNALNNEPMMAPFRAFDQQQFLDVAAYIGDTPQVSALGEAPDRSQDTVTFSFVAPATLQPTPRDLALHHAVVPPADLVVHGVAVTGIGGAAPSGRFRLTADACTAQTLAAQATCALSVSFEPNGTAAVNDLLTFNLQVGMESFTRHVLLQGMVAGTPPPAPPPPPPAPAPAPVAGGATPLASLAGLLLALVALRRR